MNDMDIYEQLIKLGDMMGDGLHHEADGKWIEKEYTRLLKLDPAMKQIFKERRLAKNVRVNDSLKNLLATKSCPCGGSLRQSRSGSVILYCNDCNKRYKAVNRK